MVGRDTAVVSGPPPVRENAWGDSGGARGNFIFSNLFYYQCFYTAAESEAM